MSATPVRSEARARAWRTGSLAAICDRLQPWEHGTIARASRYSSYYHYNLVRVETDAALSVGTLLEVVERALGDLPHRRLDFDFAPLGTRVRAAFESQGWRTVRLLWMRHEDGPPDGSDVPVEEVEYDDVHELRVLWNREDSLGDAADSPYYGYAREVALTFGARVLAVREHGRPVAFAQLEFHEGGAEITNVFVHPEHRGQGLGTALTRAAIRAGQGADDLWISADDEDRPKHLYARLGFRPAWTAMEFTQLPGTGR
jgi:ribosomal protein S18 acetylase RimI-like enzyme